MFKSFLYSRYDKEEIKNGWRSGEGYDFYYTDENGTEHTFTYDGKAGLKLGFLDKLILGLKKGDINLGNLGQNFVGEENTETKILLSSLMTGGTGIKKKGKGLPIVGAKNSNFEPSKIDAAGRLDVENINVENLKSANVGVNGQKIGERVVE